MSARLVWLSLLLLFASVASGQGVTLPVSERIVLDNGTVFILSEKHDVPLIGMTAILRGGALADPAGKEGVASLFAELLQKGAGERSAAEFAEAIDAVGGRLSASAEREHIEIRGDFLSRDADLMVELLADLLLRPTLARSELDKLRDRAINLIRAAKDGDPGQLMPVYGSAFLFGEHPYGRSVYGSETSLATISQRDIANYYAQQVGADRLVVAITGAFDATDLAEQLTSAFGGWRAAGSELPAPEAPVKEAGNRVLLVDKPGATQTYFWIGNVGVARGYERRAAIDLTNTVFGGRFTSMLNTALRIESGLTYGARSLLTRYSQPGAVAIYSYTRSDATIEAIDMALAILAQLQDSGIDQPMIDSARNYVLGQFPTDLETAAQLAGAMALIEAAGLDSDYVNAYGAAITAVDGEAIRAVIDEVYPQSGELVFVLLGDAASIRDSVTKYGPVTEMSITEPRFSP